MKTKHIHSASQKSAAQLSSRGTAASGPVSVIAQRQLAAIMNSPRQVTQQKTITTIGGSPRQAIQRKQAVIQRLTDAQTSSMPAPIRAYAKEGFGDSYGIIAKNTPTIPEFKQYVDEVTAIVDEIRQYNNYLSMDLLSPKDRKKYTTARNKAEASRLAIEQGIVGRLGSTQVTGMGSTSSTLAPASAPEPQAPKLALKANTALSVTAKPHGNFVNIDTNAKIKSISREELEEYVKNNVGLFQYSQTMAEGDSYTLKLGTKKNKKKKIHEDWYLTVRHYAKDNQVLIDHFGPFGGDTQEEIAANNYYNS